MRLLNPDQERRLDSHLSLLGAELATLEESPEVAASGGAARLRDALKATRAATERLRQALDLPATAVPLFKQRVAAFAGVWAARVDDLRARPLGSYGPVNPGIASQLDLLVDRLRLSLEQVADAAAELP